LVALLATPAASATERAHAFCLRLLDRYGLVTREVAELETIPGGFSAMYPVLRALEDAGKIRRGYFADGLGGAQFANPGAVDRLRGSKGGPTLCLAAVDPANPFGWLLPWPESDLETKGRPRRAVGNHVVLAAGKLAVFVDGGGRRLLTFDRSDLTGACRALALVAAQRRKRYLRIDEVDGASARTSPHVQALLDAGFHPEGRALVLEASS